MPIYFLIASLINIALALNAILDNRITDAGVHISLSLCLSNMAAIESIEKRLK